MNGRPASESGTMGFRRSCARVSSLATQSDSKAAGVITMTKTAHESIPSDNLVEPLAGRHFVVIPEWNPGRRKEGGQLINVRTVSATVADEDVSGHVRTVQAGTYGA